MSESATRSLSCLWGVIPFLASIGAAVFLAVYHNGGERSAETTGALPNRGIKKALIETWRTPVGGVLPTCIKDTIDIRFAPFAGSMTLQVPTSIFLDALAGPNAKDFARLCDGRPSEASRLYLLIPTQRAAGLPPLRDGALLPAKIVINGFVRSQSRARQKSEFLDRWIAEGNSTIDVDGAFERGGPNGGGVYRSRGSWKTPRGHVMGFTCGAGVNFCIIEYNSRHGLLLTYHVHIGYGSHSRDLGVYFSDLEVIDRNVDRLLQQWISDAVDSKS